MLLTLTPTELRLILALTENPGQVLSRRQLLSAAWDQEYLGDSRIVDAAVQRLRGKIEDDPGRTDRHRNGARVRVSLQHQPSPMRPTWLQVDGLRTRLRARVHRNRRDHRRGQPRVSSRSWRGRGSIPTLRMSRPHNFATNCNTSTEHRLGRVDACQPPTDLPVRHDAHRRRRSHPSRIRGCGDHSAQLRRRFGQSEADPFREARLPAHHVGNVRQCRGHERGRQLRQRDIGQSRHHPAAGRSAGQVRTTCFELSASPSPPGVLVERTTRAVDRVDACPSAQTPGQGGRPALPTATSASDSPKTE